MNPEENFKMPTDRMTKYWAPTVETEGPIVLFMMIEEVKHGLIHEDDDEDA
jgi:hypothetical protein